MCIHIPTGLFLKHTISFCLHWTLQTARMFHYTMKISFEILDTKRVPDRAACQTETTKLLRSFFAASTFAHRLSSSHCFVKATQGFSTADWSVLEHTTKLFEIGLACESAVSNEWQWSAHCDGCASPATWGPSQVHQWLLGKDDI